MTTAIRAQRRSLGAATLSARRAGSQQGFTLAELLIAVAVIGVLVAVAAVAVSNHLANLAYLRRCEAAREIFIAAQNNVAELQSSGQWALNEDVFAPPAGSAALGDAMGPVAPGCAAGSARAYYVAGRSDRPCINALLPAGSVDDAVWRGQYVIEYDYDAGAVCGVFFTEDPASDGASPAVLAYYRNTPDLRAKESLTARENGLPIVGYADADAVGGLDYASLEVPEVSVDAANITVVDPNRTDGLERLETFQTVTVASVTDPDTAILLRLDVRAGEPVLVAYEKTLVSGGAAPTRVYRCILDGSDGSVSRAVCVLDRSDPAGAPDTYRLNMTTLQAALVAAGGAGMASGTEVTVESRCSSAARFCRSTYGYALGVWRTGDPLVLGSNILNAHSQSDVVSLYVKDDGTVHGGGEGADNSVAFTVRNFFDTDTVSTVPISYSVNFSSDLVQGVEVTALGSDDQAPRVLSGPDTYYRLARAGTREEHLLTFTFAAGKVAALDKVTVVPVQVKGYGRLDAAGAPLSGASGSVPTVLTFYLTFYPASHADLCTWYVRDSVNAAFAELVVKAGSQGAPSLRLGWSEADPGGLAVDSTDDDLLSASVAGHASLLRPLAPEQAASVKFLKTNPGISYATGEELGPGASKTVRGVTWQVAPAGN